MLSSIKAFLFHPQAGLSLAGWLILLALLFIVNEVFSWTKKTRAQSTFQAIIRLALKMPLLQTALKYFPLFGPILLTVLRYLAGPDPEGVRDVPGKVLDVPPTEAPPPLPPPPTNILLIGFFTGALLGGCPPGTTVVDGAHALKTVASDAFTVTLNAFKKYDRDHQIELAQAGNAEALKRYRAEVQVPFRKAAKSTENALSALSAGLDAAKAGMEQDFGKLAAEVMRGLADVTELITRHAIPIPKPSLDTTKEKSP